MKKELIKKPKVYIITTILLILLWTPILIYGIIKMLEDRYYAVLPIFMICFLFIINAIVILAYAINFSIEVNDNNIIITNWLKRKKSYDIKELYIKWKVDSFIVYHNNKRLAKVSKFDVNFKKITKIEVKW